MPVAAFSSKKPTITRDYYHRRLKKKKKPTVFSFSFHPTQTYPAPFGLRTSPPKRPFLRDHFNSLFLGCQNKSTTSFVSHTSKLRNGIAHFIHCPFFVCAPPFWTTDNASLTSFYQSKTFVSYTPISVMVFIYSNGRCLYHQIIDGLFTKKWYQ